MGSVVANIKRFWTAEEIPRWFGMPLVLVYLAGLGLVGYLGISHVRHEAETQFERSTRYATTTLLTRLETHSASDLVDPVIRRRCQQDLFEFSSFLPTRWARILDDRRQVIASTVGSEVGTVVIDDRADIGWPDRMVFTSIECDDGCQDDVLIRAPIDLRDHAGDRPESGGNTEVGSDHSKGPAATGEIVSPRSVFLEIRLLPSALESSSLAAHADTFLVALIAFGILFMLYHCLRTQFRSITSIADRLQSNRKRMPQNLASLRLSDDMDQVADAWNELVDFAHECATTVQLTRADDELAKALQQAGGGALAEALHAIPDGIIYLRDEIQFEFVNRTACKLMGWTQESLKETTLHDVESKGFGAEVLTLLRESLHADGSYEGRTHTLDVDGAQSDQCSSYRLTIIPLQRSRKSGECIVFLRDVSQQVRADRAREDFVTQVTHELRTPLTNIRAYAETLSSGMFDDPKVISECYNVITKETRRLSRLIEDILSVSQLEVGSIELNLDDVDLKSMLTDSLRDVRGMADEKNIDLQLQLSPKLEPVRADRDKLAIVINNLLGNAIKYTPQGGNVVLGCQFSGDSVVITCKDNGLGIDEVDHARVFEKFQRVNDPAVQQEAGTGIGLYTAREIVHRHGGEMELMSKKGEGSTFVVKLPYEPSRATSLSVEE